MIAFVHYPCYLWPMIEGGIILTTGPRSFLVKKLQIRHLSYMISAGTSIIFFYISPPINFFGRTSNLSNKNTWSHEDFNEKISLKNHYEPWQGQHRGIHSEGLRGPRDCRRRSISGWRARRVERSPPPRSAPSASRHNRARNTATRTAVAPLWWNTRKGSSCNAALIPLLFILLYIYVFARNLNVNCYFIVDIFIGYNFIDGFDICIEVISACIIKYDTRKCKRKQRIFSLTKTTWLIHKCSSGIIRW